MPFGTKEVMKTPHVDSAAQEKNEKLLVDFDAVYRILFAPALEAAGLQPFRADDEKAAGDILRDMFAELVTADFVLADISILNANVFYELGIRHAIGPRGVICLHAGWSSRPFDVAPMRTFKYDGKLFRVGVDHNADWQAQVKAETDRLTATLRGAVASDRTTEGSPVYSNLPNLIPADASRIDTARFKYYRALSEDWNQRVMIAGREGRAEDILTLAGDTPSPYYRRKLLRQCGDALVTLGRFAQAEQILRELDQDCEGGDSLDAFRVKCQLALIANRLGRGHEAELKLTTLSKTRPGDSEARGLLGRVYKDMWRAKWSNAPTVEERLSIAATNVALAKKALATYETAIRYDLRSYYNGINAVTIAALIEHTTRDKHTPTKAEIPGIEDLKASIRLGAEVKLEDTAEGVWARATLGEMHLVDGRQKEALEFYKQVVADPDLNWFHVQSMSEQVQLFEKLGFQREAVEPVSQLLQQRLSELPHPSARFGKIAVASGHMIDAPGRKNPRFPNAKSDAVSAEIARILDRWEIGPGDLAICGGACGADILFAEESLRRGATVRLLLSQEVADFSRESVAFAGNEWVRRFQKLSQKAHIATQPERLGAPPKDVSIYARTNLWIINTARVEADDSARIHALLVWDENPTGDGPGGTSDFESKVRRIGGIVEIVNPTTLPSSTFTPI